MNRLKDADFFPGPSLSPALFITEKSIAYDLNGNITALKRYGSSGLVNELSFTHSGNRMTALTDAQATGSEAGPKTFTYDANGNLTYDDRKHRFSYSRVVKDPVSGQGLQEFWAWFEK